MNIISNALKRYDSHKRLNMFFLNSSLGLNLVINNNGWVSVSRSTFYRYTVFDFSPHQTPPLVHIHLGPKRWKVTLRRPWSQMWVWRFRSTHS